MIKYQSFESFLMEKHCETNPQLLDDMLPDDFNDWVSERLSVDEIIEYAEKWHKQEDEKTHGKIILG